MKRLLAAALVLALSLAALYLPKALRWEPPKTAIPVATGPDWPIRFYDSPDYLVGEYQYKLVVYERPPGVRLQLAPPPHNQRWPFLRSGEAYPVSRLKELRSITFKHPNFPVYFSTPPTSPNLFVCSWLLTGLNDTQCRRLPDNPSGEHGQFCGLISMAGDVVFRFPITQSRPDRLALPLYLTGSGKRAAVGIGRLRRESTGCGYESVADIGEVWIWEHPDKVKTLTRKDLPSSDWTDLRLRLGSGRL